MGLSGNFYSNEFTTSGAAADLMVQYRTECGVADATLKKMTIVSLVNIGIKINRATAYSYLHLNSDGEYVLSLDERNVVVDSLVIEQNTAAVFLAGVY